MDTVLHDIIEIIEEIVDLDNVHIVPEAVLGDDIPIDSVDMLRILARLENRYQISFKPSDILSLGTLDDLLKSVCHKRFNNKQVTI